MMGKGHVAVGTCGFLCFGQLASSLGGHPLASAELAAGTIVAGGAALLADLDHPQATIAGSLGILTRGLSNAVNRLSGGHRHGTHSLLAAALVSVGLATALNGAAGEYVALGVVFFAASLVLRLLTEARGAVCASLAAIVALVVMTVAPTRNWLLVAVEVGYLSHLWADYITVEGIPLFWPVFRKQRSIAFIGHTESRREKLLARGCGVLAVCLLLLALVPLWRSAQPDTSRRHVAPPTPRQLAWH
jgi:membrane-bound metal-dependent hydrolase YbcI (DUF457 family)